ncbi:unnamed protein product [Adineta ricciae]|uniref:Uncharacterized protein n=1 Tax=Adineta ricciae TaxID=249248 RepID=A0A815EQ04_ADIRI|nr:unnamed protein product [Adineta ricciae]CAF1309365.1 unnamed protein product [Adineta ricciae]
MIPSMCEQVQNPEPEVPKAIVYSVIAAGMIGIIYLIPLLFVMSNVNKLLSIPTGQPIAYIFTQSTGLLGLIYFYSSAAFNAFTGVTTICLSTSYGPPILILLVRGHHLVHNAPFHLGKLGYVINLITIVCIPLAMVIFSMPTAIPVSVSTMNFVSAIFVFFAGISIVWYIVWGKQRFIGPPISCVE